MQNGSCESSRRGFARTRSCKFAVLIIFKSGGGGFARTGSCENGNTPHDSCLWHIFLRRGGVIPVLSLPTQGERPCHLIVVPTPAVRSGLPDLIYITAPPPGPQIYHRTTQPPGSLFQTWNLKHRPSVTQAIGTAAWPRLSHHVFMRSPAEKLPPPPPTAPECLRARASRSKRWSSPSQA